MKKILVILLFGIFFVQSTVAQIRWLETVHNFGTFNEEMGNVSCEMRFINIGTEDLVINQVRPTCGCTAGDYPKRAIAPGDTASVKLTYNPIGRPGKFRKDVVVLTNTMPPRSILIIEGTVVSSAASVAKKYPVKVGPLSFNSLLMPFGEMPKGDTRTSFLYGYNHTNDKVAVSFDNLPPMIKVKSIPDTVAAGELVTLTIFYDSNKKNDWGTVTDNFTIRASTLNGADIGTAKVETISIIVDDFSKMGEKELKNAPIMALSTEKIDAGIIAKNSTAKSLKYEFEIENKGKSTLKIRKIASINKALTISPISTEIKKGKKQKIEVEVNPSLIEDSMLNAKIMIINNDPAASQSSLGIVGELK